MFAKLLSADGDGVKFATNTAWLLSERAARIVVVMLLNVVLARYLGPTDYGLLAYSLSIVGIFMLLSSLGLNDILIKELHNAPAERTQTLGTGFALVLLGGLTASGIIAGLALVVGDEATAPVLAALALTTAFGGAAVFEAFFNALVMGRSIAIAKSVQLIVLTALKLTLVLVGAPMLLFAVAFTVDHLVLLLALAWAYRRSGFRFNDWRITGARARTLLAQSWPALLSGLLIAIYMRIDQIMIKHFLDAEQVGFYAVAVQLSQAWYFVPMLVSTSLFPSLLAVRQDRDRYRQRLLWLYRLMTFIGLAAAIAATLVAEPLVLLLFGETYHAAATVLKLHIWAGLFVGLGVVSNHWLVAENQTRHLLTRALLGCSVNVLLNIYLIPRWGINGAAVATILSQVSSAWLYDALHPTTRPGFVLKLRAILFPNPLPVAGN